MEQKVKIFLFHRVSPERSLLWDPMSPELFRRIVKYIARNFDVQSFEDLFLSNDIEGNNKPKACISFDDGYADFISYALPILDEYKLKSSLYVVTECADKGLPPWTYMLDNAFINSGKKDASVLSDVLEISKDKLRWSGSNERILYGKFLKPQLKKMPDNKRRFIFNELIRFFDDVNLPQGMMLNWEEINQLVNAGVVIGSHTVSHPLLANIEDDKVVMEELEGSACIIKQKTGINPLCISYPVGSYNERIIDLSVKAGYKLGLAVDNKIYRGGLSPAFNIPRIELYNEGYVKSILRIKGGIAFAKKILRQF